VPGGYVETKKRDHSLGGILKVMAFVKKRTDIAGSIECYAEVKLK